MRPMSVMISCNRQRSCRSDRSAAPSRKALSIRKFQFVTPGLVEFDHPSLKYDTRRRRRDDTGPYHPQSIYHPSFSRKPALGAPVGSQGSRGPYAAVMPTVHLRSRPTYRTKKKLKQKRFNKTPFRLKKQLSDSKKNNSKKLT